MTFPTIIGKRKLGIGALGLGAIVKIAGWIAAGSLAPPIGLPLAFLAAAVSTAYIIKQSEVDKVDREMEAVLKTRAE